METGFEQYWYETRTRVKLPRLVVVSLFLHLVGVTALYAVSQWKFDDGAMRICQVNFIGKGPLTMKSVLPPGPPGPPVVAAPAEPVKKDPPKPKVEPPQPKVDPPKPKLDPPKPKPEEPKKETPKKDDKKADKPKDDKKPDKKDAKKVPSLKAIDPPKEKTKSAKLDPSDPVEIEPSDPVESIAAPPSDSSIVSKADPTQIASMITSPTGQRGALTTGGMPFELTSWGGLVQRKVELAWVMPGGVRTDTGEVIAEVAFTVDKDGNLLDEPVVTKQASDPAVGESGINAVKLAAPFPPLPMDSGKSEQRVICAFSLLQ